MKHVRKYHQLNATIAMAWLIVFLAGCAYPQRWYFSTPTSGRDERIRGWELSVRIHHYVEEEIPDSIREFALDFFAKPKAKPPEKYLGLDSVIVFRPDSSGEFSEVISLLAIENHTPAGDFHMVYQNFPAGVFSPTPDSVLCIVYYILLDRESGNREELSLDYRLHLSKRKEWYIGE